MVIYKTTNLVNGKFYIGKDENNNNNNKYLGSGKILKLAFEKYGKENFKKEIIESCISKVELEEREKYWIDKLSATTLGYNITEGGTGGQTKFKTIYQYGKNGDLLKKWDSSSLVEKKLGIDSSAILKNCKGVLKSAGGYIWSYESNGVDKYNDNKSISILQYDMNGDFIESWVSMSKAEKNLGLTRGNIYKVIDDNSKTSGGYYWASNKGIIEQKIKIKYPYKTSIEVLQCDVNGNIVKTWKSINEAAKGLKYSASSILSAIKNFKQYKNHYWYNKNNI
jgi:group I intron endonuclease